MRFSITIKLLVPLAVSLFAFTAIGTKQVMNLYADKQIEANKAHALGLLDSVAMLFDNSLDPEVLRRVVTTIALDEHVAQSLIVAPDNDEVVASSAYRYAPISINSLPSLLLRTYNNAKDSPVALVSEVEGMNYALAYPIKVVSENQVDFRSFIILVYFDTHVLEKDYATFSQTIAILALLLWSLLTSVCYLVLHRVVIRPIERFGHAISKQSKSDKAVLVKISTKDEIGDIALEYNRLRETEAASFKSAKKALKQAEALAVKKSQFLANMSHELRTPINGIMGMAQMCIDTDDQDKQQSSLQKLLKSSRLLLSIVNDILDFSKLEVGRIELNPEMMLLHEVFDDVVASTKILANEKSLNFVVNVSEECPKAVCVDDIRLRQIVTNLLSNAVKFTEQGSVSIDVSFQKLDAPKGCLTIEVKDTGIGIDPENIDNLFTPFEQGDSGISRKFGGTGLGLSITRYLVRLMDGEISVKSQPLAGSLFSIQIPCDFSDTFSPAQELDSTLAQHKKVHVLVVEDNEINALVATDMLENMGHDVMVAINGEDAVEKVSSHEFELILMDVQMPVMDGYQATEVLREQGITIPIIGLSANVFEEDRRKAMDAGMNDYLHKPIEKAALFKAMGSYLS